MAASPGSVEELILLRLEGLATRSTASKAWQTISASLSPGTPSQVEVLTLAALDYNTSKFRGRGAADASFRALGAAPPVHLRSKAKELKGVAIRVEPPAIRTRGQALSPLYRAIERACLPKHRTRGRVSASIFFMGCAAEGSCDFAPLPGSCGPTVVRVRCRRLGPGGVGLRLAEAHALGVCLGPRSGQ